MRNGGKTFEQAFKLNVAQITAGVPSNPGKVHLPKGDATTFTLYPGARARGRYIGLEMALTGRQLPVAGVFCRWKLRAICVVVPAVGFAGVLAGAQRG